MTEFEQIYRAYFQDVYLYLRRLSNDANLAEEITSETFFKAMQSIHGFRGDCDIRAWLCQIAKNCYYSHVREANRTDSLDEDRLQTLPQRGDAPEERVAQQDEAARVREALHALPEPYKEVFLWRVFAELSFRQIGQIFRKSENWACVTYHRARTKIRQRLEEDNHET